MNLVVELSNTLEVAKAETTGFGIVTRVNGDTALVDGVPYAIEGHVEPGAHVMILGNTCYSLSGIPVYRV